jgi:phytoene dehydrogenase-like protein
MPDVVVIGGGHNGLVCAAYLARAGLSVTVVERRPVLGGAAVTEEVYPGFKYSVCSYAVSLLRPEIIRELDLARHGLTLLPLDGTFTPLHDDYLWRPEDPRAQHAEIARHSRRDADAFADFNQTMAAMAAFTKPLLGMIPPDVNALDVRAILDGLGLGRAYRQLGPRLQHLLIQLLSASALDFVERWFESDPLKATLAASGIIGTFLGIRSPGTAYVLLHHYMGEIDGHFRSWGLPRGGTGAVSMAIAGAATAAGATLRTASPVARVLLEHDRAMGVVLESGEEIRARAVASSADLRVTFARLVGLEHLPPEFAAVVRGFRYRGATAKVNLALDALPDF